MPLITHCLWTGPHNTDCPPHDMRGTPRHRTDLSPLCPRLFFCSSSALCSPLVSCLFRCAGHLATTARTVLQQRLSSRKMALITSGPSAQHGMSSRKTALITSGPSAQHGLSSSTAWAIFLTCPYTTWTIFQHDGPNHLGHPTPQHGLPSNTMALITSDCGPLGPGPAAAGA